MSSGSYDLGTFNLAGADPMQNPLPEGDPIAESKQEDEGRWTTGSIDTCTTTHRNPQEPSWLVGTTLLDERLGAFSKGVDELFHLCIVHQRLHLESHPLETQLPHKHHMGQASSPFLQPKNRSPIYHWKFISFCLNMKLTRKIHITSNYSYPTGKTEHRSKLLQQLNKQRQETTETHHRLPWWLLPSIHGTSQNQPRLGMARR